jgi:ectoine hydroxylase-related dioxygenase (phytanoyl-CoA dioxygenase family)
VENYSVASDGFSMFEGLLNESAVDDLVSFMEQNISVESGRGGARNLLDFPEMLVLAESSVVRNEVEAVLGRSARVVRGILFDKTEGANWKVPWHQDVTIAVVNKVEAEGFGPWSMKAGVLHVQPPATVLERMVSVRLHLDDCPKKNRALRVIARSHTSGKLEERLIQELAERSATVTCSMLRGGVLMMRPLLLHASSASTIPGHRRVIHFDYAAAELPSGMNWAVDQA